MDLKNSFSNVTLPLPSSAINIPNNTEAVIPVNASPLLNRKQAARYLGVIAQTLAQWAYTGRVQLPFIKIGRKAMYRKADLDAFIAANTHGEQVNALGGNNE